MKTTTYNCDKCCKEIKTYHNVNLSSVNSKDYEKQSHGFEYNKHADLCNDCYKDFKKYWDNFWAFQGVPE